MNLMLNMKDINKILAKTHFKCKKPHIFMKTCLYDSVGSLPVMPSLLPYGLWGRSQVSLFLQVWWALSVYYWYNFKIV
jgi:hypothetical protein